MAGPRVRGLSRALASGPRVFLRHPTRRDRDAFIDFVETSRTLHGRWTPYPDASLAFDDYLRRARRADAECLFACRVEDGALVGVFTIAQIVRGAFHCGFLGYSAHARYARRGYMTEALHLVVRHAFTTLELHRLEANIQPENARSIAFASRCGFRKEGFSPRYLKIAGRWRDHERWAITQEDVRRTAGPRDARST